ncbi:MAG TPA: hypothetical protein VK178_07230 [Opitutaceae bacterium]|nr:hypothetical protein [Opitutaceae bacterium]
MNARTLYMRPTPGGSHQTLPVADTPVQLDASKFAAADMVAWQVQTAAVIVTFDGTTPSASNGFVLEAGQSGTWSGASAQAAKFLQATTAAKVAAQPFSE